MVLPRKLRSLSTFAAMSLFVSSLNSGSNGNCYYIGNEQEAVLVDVGLSARETERRLKRQDLSVKKIKAVFITHEHTDHISGLYKFAKRHQVPVYMTSETLRESRIEPVRIQVRNFVPHEAIRIGALSITPFPTMHDARDPHGFLVSHHEVSAGVFTDLGVITPAVIKYFKQCHAAFLESNYDVDMLRTGDYPPELQNRISSNYGHLSNVQALECFLTHRPSFMSHLFLSHLSENNNTPEIVHNLFSQVAGQTSIVIASRHKESGVYRIGGQLAGKISPLQERSQLSLFS